MSDLQYFAEKPITEVIQDLEDKTTEFYQYLNTSGLKNKWDKATRLYYGNHFKGSSMSSTPGLRSGGEDGELSLVVVNNFRNLMKHILVMTTSQKISYDVRAVNSDPDALNQARIGNSILDYYMKEKRLSRYTKSAVERAIVTGKGFAYVKWDKGIGRPYDIQEYEVDGEQRQRVVYDGDVSVTSIGGPDVIYDFRLNDWTKNQWIIVKELKNKYDLAATRPDLRDAILSSSHEPKAQYSLGVDQSDDHADLITVWSFYHKRTDAMPNGRFIEYCDEHSVFYDGPIPYDDLPVYRVVPGEVFDTPEGYSDSFDLIGLQELMNILVSTVATNQSSFGVQNVLVPDGCNLTAEQLSKNLRFLKYNAQGGKPEALQLTASPPEIFKMIEMIDKFCENLSGVNSVARGNPEASLKSGVALSLVQSMAVQYASGIQESYAELCEDVGTAILKLLKNFAKTERMISLAGQSNKSAMASFSGSSIDKLDRVVVDLGNPMSRTTSGKIEIADNLLQKGLIQTPSEYLTVLSTGQLDPAVRSKESELQLVHAENNDLLDGKPVRAIVFDAHLLHMQEHKSILADPSIRLNEQALQNALSHIQDHVQLYKGQDPLYAMLNGEQPSPQPMAPPPGPNGPMSPDQGPPPPPEQGQGPGPMPPQMNQSANGVMN